MMNRLDETQLVDAAVALPPNNGRNPVHVFDRESILAVNTALDCGRPLLVRGEPGTGKSQLAWAVAKALDRVPKSRVLDARTEPHELMWEYDAIGRLADAQAYGAMRTKTQAARPDRIKYTAPGPLWWAFDWASARAQAKKASQTVPRPVFGKSKNGVVLLIDEIDKADMAVPNALLECLGNGTFRVPGIAKEIARTEPGPLVMLTTNTDRVLPDAFVRRCVVLHMRIPKTVDELIEWLTKCGRAHFEELSEAVLEAAASKVAKDRHRVQARRVYCPPGLAEYIDLLTAVAREDEAGQIERIEQIAHFVLNKHEPPVEPLRG